MNEIQIQAIFAAVKSELDTPNVFLEIVDFSTQFKEEMEQYGDSTMVNSMLMRTVPQTGTVFVNSTKLDESNLGVHADWASMLAQFIIDIRDPILKPVLTFNSERLSRDVIIKLNVPSVEENLTTTLNTGPAQNNFVSNATNIAWQMASIRRIPDKYKKFKFDRLSPKKSFLEAKRAVTPRGLELGIAEAVPRLIGYSLICPDNHARRIKRELDYVSLGFRLIPLFSGVDSLMRPFASDSIENCKGLLAKLPQNATAIFREWLNFRGWLQAS